jgi:hypothetical protein
MEAENAQEQQALQGELALAQEKLDGLLGDLHAIDRALDDLTPERTQHRLLQEACVALEELARIGGAGLFWGERASAATGEDQIRHARGRVDAFQKRLDEIEEQRHSVLEAIDRQQLVTHRIDADLLEVEEEAERYEQEWIVQRELGPLPDEALVMPWTRGGEDDVRYRKTLRRVLLASLLFALLAPWIPLPVRPPEEAVEVPDRVVRMMMQPRPVPPPPPPQEVVVEPKPVEVAETAPETKPPEGPGKGTGEGPATGPGKGILAFREKLSSFKENQALSRLGAQARIHGAGTSSGLVQRSMVTTMAPGSSGGINLADLSRNVGGGAGGGAGLEGVQIARATSTIAGGSGGGERGVGRDGPPLGRTDEEIQIVFDRYKSALYRLYNRELRNDPTLKGQMVLRIRIEPDGSVTLCELQVTDMKAPQLVAQVLERVRTFDFGAKEGIPAITILYPIDFLPAT